LGDNIVEDENWNLTDEIFAVFYDHHSCNAGPSDDKPLVEQTKCPVFVTISTIVWVSTSTSKPSALGFKCGTGNARV